MQQRRALLIGTGIAEGPNRATDAAQRAIIHPLLEDMPITEAKTVLMNVTGSRQSLRLHEAKSAAGVIQERTNLEDMVIGAMYDDSMDDRLKVTLIASGAIRDNPDQSEHFSLHSGTAANVVAAEQSVQGNGISGFQDKTNWDELDRPAFRRRHV